MQDTEFLISIPRECVGRSSSSLSLYENSHCSLGWQTPDPRVSPMSLMSSSLVLDPIYELRKKFPDMLWTTETLIISAHDPLDVYEHVKAFAHYEIPLDVRHVSLFTGELRPHLKTEVRDLLDGIVSYVGVTITVTTNFILHIYGTKEAVAYAQYKLLIALNHLYGYSVWKLELPFSQQTLVAGPNRQNLLTIFQQTGVNVYIPPTISAGLQLSVDEIYLAGDKTQLVFAEKLLRDVVIRKTDTLEKECVISSFVRDIMVTKSHAEIDEIMLRNATFIQIPPIGCKVSTIRVMGTTRRSIDNTIAELMKLCGSVYCMEVQALFDQGLSAQICATGTSLMKCRNGTVLYGLNRDIHQTLQALKAAETNGISISVLMEQPVELMDFILGKKQGKISKVINGTSTTITVEKLHEHNFRLRLSGERASLIAEALKLLEEELPAEKSLYVPEVYHKQIIGQGGLAIQMLMRKYNVYMRFANTTKEKYPNAFGDMRSDNVLIRCPTKNCSQIDAATQELMSLVADLAKGHFCRSIKLTRNHRRILLESQSNGLRDAEVSSGAAIKLPTEEAKDLQNLEISGQTIESTQSAIALMSQLLSQTDYEFRIPWSSKFVEVVGPRGDFCKQVSAPLFLAMSAQVQAFEKVQIEGDPMTYSQVVVSVHENIEGDLFEDISQVITSFLRKYHLDIVDKGRLTADLQVESFEPTTENSVITQDTQQTLQGPALGPDLSKSALYHSPQQHEAQISLEYLRMRSQNIRTEALLSSSSTLANQSARVSVPKETPEGLPSRPPMSSVQLNRNFDETPIKKRGFENQQDDNGNTVRSRAPLTPKTRVSRFSRWL